MEPDLRDIYYFAQPHLVTDLQERKITKIQAQGHYCYALSETTNELYAWGFGENYVLGNRDDENVYTPLLVHPKQFHENKVKEIGLGVMHVVMLTTASTEESQLPEFDVSVLDLPPVPKEDEGEEKKKDATDDNEEKKEPPKKQEDDVKE